MKKILVVDDNEWFSNFIEVLFSTDFEVHKAHDGLMGVEKAFEVLPDLILLDINMPRLSGVEVLRRLDASTQTSSIPVIVITAQAMDSKMAQALRREPNVASFLNKTCGTNTILNEVYQVLGDPSDNPGGSTPNPENNPAPPSDNPGNPA